LHWIIQSSLRHFWTVEVEGFPRLSGGRPIEIR
jgi:hypothetical protein